MATLLELVSRDRGAGGATKIRKGTSIEEQVTPVQQLATGAGLESAPTGAIGTFLVGGNINQQKMAGTPQQLQGAQTLQETIRRDVGQERAEETGEEKRRRQIQERLQPLSASQEKAQEFISSKVAEMETRAGQAVAAGGKGELVTRTLREDLGGGTIPTGTDLTTLQDKLKEYQNTGSMESLLEVNRLLGREINSTMTQDELQGILQTVTDAVVSEGQKLPDNVTVGDIYGQLGITTTINELESLLGLQPGSLQGMTVTEFEPYVDQLARIEYQRGEELQGQMSGGTIGTAEIGAARQTGREMARTGVKVAEASMDRLVTAVEGADQVEFAGETYTIGELLSDENIGQMISDYLTSPEGSATRDNLEKTEPAFTSFIQQYEEALKLAMIEQEKGIGSFRKIQDANIEKIGDIDTGILGAISEDLVSGDKIAMQASEVDPEEIGGIVAAVNRPGANREEIISSANSIAGIDDKYAKEIAELSAEDAAKLTIGDVSEIGDARKQREQLSNWASTNNEDAIYSYFTGGMNRRSLEGQLRASNWATELFGVRADNLDKVLNPDGSIKNMSQVLGDLTRGVTPDVSVMQAIQNSIRNPSQNRVNVGNVQTKLDTNKVGILETVLRKGVNNLDDADIWRAGQVGVNYKPIMDRFNDLVHIRSERTKNTIRDRKLGTVDIEHMVSNNPDTNMPYGINGAIKIQQDRISALKELLGRPDHEVDKNEIQGMIAASDQRLNELNHVKNTLNDPNNTSFPDIRNKAKELERQIERTTWERTRRWGTTSKYVG